MNAKNQKKMEKYLARQAAKPIRETNRVAFGTKSYHADLLNTDGVCSILGILSKDGGRDAVINGNERFLDFMRTNVHTNFFQESLKEWVDMFAKSNVNQLVIRFAASTGEVFEGAITASADSFPSFKS